MSRMYFLQLPFASFCINPFCGGKEATGGTAVFLFSITHESHVSGLILKVTDLGERHILCWAPKEHLFTLSPLQNGTNNNFYLWQSPLVISQCLPLFLNSKGIHNS